MPSLLPFREVRLPVAPPLYVWEDDIQSALTYEEEDDYIHTFAATTTDSTTTHGGEKTPPVQDTPSSPEHSLQTKAIHRLPPRRPRRCTTPPRNPRNIDIGGIPLKPLHFERNNRHQNKTKTKRSNVSSTPSSPAGFRGEEEEEQQDSHSPGEGKSRRSGNAMMEINYEGSTLSLSQLISSKSLGSTASLSTSSSTAATTATEGAAPSRHVSLVFCIRSSGCAVCRGHGMQLAELVENLNHVHMLGVVKNEAISNARKLAFYTDYFPFPLYQDDDWQLFSALGDRQLSLWKLLKSAPAVMKLCVEKRIASWPVGTDLWTYGGLLIFDAEQRVRFVYYEKFGDELDTEAIMWAIEQARHPLGGANTTATRQPTAVPGTQQAVEQTSDTDGTTSNNHPANSPVLKSSSSSPWNDLASSLSSPPSLKNGNKYGGDRAPIAPQRTGFLRPRKDQAPMRPVRGGGD